MANVRVAKDARSLAVPVRAGAVRACTHAVEARRAAALFGGPLARGAALFGLSKGRASMLEVISWALESTGPVDVMIATWTIGNEETRALRRLIAERRVRSLRMVLDPSFFRRQPGYAAALRSRFGPEAIRVGQCHAKLAVLEGDGWGVTIASSANLNENRRLEFFHVTDDPALAAAVRGALAEWFETPEDADVAAAFEAWRSGDVGSVALDDGPYGADVRRGGLSYVGKG